MVVIPPGTVWWAVKNGRSPSHSLATSTREFSGADVLQFVRAVVLVWGVRHASEVEGFVWHAVCVSSPRMALPVQRVFEEVRAGTVAAAESGCIC